MSNRDAYTAIADPTRRAILDLLHDRGVSMAGDIAAHFDDLSRPAISRHLRILKECGVVDVYRAGKAQNYSLNPLPLRRIHDGWLANFGDMQAKSLAALRKRVDSEMTDS